MIKIEFIYTADCPNACQTRKNLKKALSDLSLSLTWTEWDLTRSCLPTSVKRYGSPTILLNGIPIGKADLKEEGKSCSLYLNKNGELTGILSVDQILVAIQQELTKTQSH